jgi:hypothetical protein
VPLRRILTVLLLAVTALVGAPAVSGASAPAAPLTAQPNADGTQTLHWALKGSSDAINVLPHLRCAADPLAAAPFAGAKVPCVWLVDHKAPLTAGPAGCPATGQAYASWRCDMRLFRDLVIDAAAAGERSIVMFNTKAKGGSGVCAWLPVALRLGAGTGSVDAADGCPERISCPAAYAGTVTADKAFDVVTGCKKVVFAGATPAKAPAKSSTTTGVQDLTACEGYRERPSGESPLWDVRNTKRGRRGMSIRVTMRRAAPITVEIRRKTAKGTQVVRSVGVCAKAGANGVTIADATGGVAGRRRYRVVVSSTVSKYPLVSSYETLPR